MTVSMGILIYVILVISFIGSELKCADDRNHKSKVDSKVNRPDSE